MSEVDTYKIFRQLEERRKRANPYSFYDKDELIDEILKNEDEIERLNNIINEMDKWLEEHSTIDFNCRDIIIHEQLALNVAYHYLQELKEKSNGSLD